MRFTASMYEAAGQVAFSGPPAGEGERIHVKGVESCLTILVEVLAHESWMVKGGEKADGRRGYKVWGMTGDVRILQPLPRVLLWVEV